MLIHLFFTIVSLFGLHALKFYNDEVNDRLYSFKYLPVSVVRLRSFPHVTNIEVLSSIFPAVIPEPKYTNPDRIVASYISTDHNEKCIGAYTRNIFSSVCDLPTYCLAVEHKVLQHEWYGSEVVFCAGHYHKHSSGYHLYEINTHATEYDDPAISFDNNMTLITYGKNIFYIPNSFLNIIAHPNIDNVFKPVGNWHSVVYQKYPVKKWHDIIVESKYNGIINTDPAQYYIRDSYYRFMCLTRINAQPYDPFRRANIYREQNCSEVIPTAEGIGYCKSFLTGHTDNYSCPLDFLPRKIEYTFSAVSFIRSTSKSWYTSLVDDIIASLSYLTKPIIEAAVKTLLEILIDTLNTLIDIISDLAPVIDKFLDVISTLVSKLIPPISRLISKLFHVIIKIIYEINHHVVLIEVILCYIVLVNHFSRDSALLLMLLLLLITGVNRLESHIDFSMHKLVDFIVNVLNMTHVNI